MLPEPLAERRSVHLSACYGQDDLLLLINGRLDFVTVEYEKHLYSGVSQAFVPVHKTMILDQ